MGGKNLVLLELKKEDTRTCYGDREIMLKKNGVGILVKEELFQSVVEIRRRSDKMTTLCHIFGEKMIQVISVYAPQSRNPNIQKDKFYGKLVHEWDMKGRKEMTLEIGDFNGHVKKKGGGFEAAHKNGIGEQIWKVECVGILQPEEFICGKYMV